ncbi:echinoderm microtubule-associated protein-like 3 isoform X2 [Syngnathoides biaculeatus]|uniref:echinoderm microtubule-associated protein-like 3 isoform X2 n=1 Tax=Syngnathoides biaculeatus TaxID=300417 RepID=UPI002ADD4A50|nr:echinoderm microtubule-associated protein-like 3 isoform X2 [Syngnathoides biaculeatus]
MTQLAYEASADGSVESTDRASGMETRVQAQEDEITLLKASLADALRRLRLHDRLLAVLKQQLIAVNPACAGLIDQVCCHENAKLSSSFGLDDGVLQRGSSRSPQSVTAGTNGPTARSTSAEPRPATADRSTQTRASEAGWDPEPNAGPHLDDALHPRAKLRRAPSMEEDDDDLEDDEEAAEQEKEPSWTAPAEEPAEGGAVVGVRGGSRSPEDADAGAPPNQNLGPTSSAASTVRQGPQKPLPCTVSTCTALPKHSLVVFRVRRNSEKLANLKGQVKRLDKKAASSATLLNHSPSFENRAKELVAIAGSPGSRRGTYSQGQSIKMFIRGRPITMYIPANIQNYEDLKMELPPERLELDWVYGYRGRDCRANLYFLPTGEAVYFIACVVVLYHISKRTQRHYRRHTDCVRCLTLHPDKVRIASGQTASVDKDGKPLQPCVHIWDSGTLVTLQHIGLGTFQRGVGSLAFSTMDSGAFLCVIDESNEHMLSVWDWARDSKQAEVKSTNETVLAVDFHPSDSSNIITCGKSHVYFWTFTAGQFTKKQGIFGKYKKPKFIQCFAFSLTGEVLSGDSEGNILTWGRSAADIRTLGKGAKETFQIMRQTKAHEGSVFTLCTLQGGALLSGGSKDRKVIRWSADLAPEQECEIPEKFGAVRTVVAMAEDEVLVGTTRNAILRGTFSNGFVAVVQGHVDEMWGLATHPHVDSFLSCGHDRQVCLWETGQHTLTWSVTLEEYGLCADFCPNGSVVSVGLSTGRWVVLDLLTAEVVSESVDGNEQLSVMRYSPDGCCLAVGSHDNFIYIYNVTEGGRRYSRFGKCNGHSSFITHLDWSKDGKYIMSNSGDYEILYWDIAGGCKLLRNRFESKDREWASYTCVLGFHVMGVWLEGSDGTDINALCRSHSESVVAVADDFCKVHLFQYPCPKPKAPSRRYEGHGSHVTNVRFTHSDSHLLSMGGKDACILQWRVVRGGTAAAGSPEPAPALPT